MQSYYGSVVFMYCCIKFKKKESRIDGDWIGRLMSL